MTDILAGNTDPKQNPIWAEKLALRNGKGGEPPPGRGQDRAPSTTPATWRPTATSRPPKDDQPGPRRRRLDGQQRPLEPALEGAGDLADRGRAAVARVRARLHEAAGRSTDFKRAEGRGQGDHRRLVGRQARAVDAGQDDAPGSSPARSRARRKAVDPDGLLYTPACGGWRVDPLKAELGPVELGRRRRRLDAPRSRRPGSDRAVRLADGLLLEAVVVGRRDRRGVLPARSPTATDKDDKDDRASPASPGSRPSRPSRPRHRPVTALP